MHLVICLCVNNFVFWYKLCGILYSHCCENVSYTINMYFLEFVNEYFNEIFKSATEGTCILNALLSKYKHRHKDDNRIQNLNPFSD